MASASNRSTRSGVASAKALLVVAVIVPTSIGMDTWITARRFALSLAIHFHARRQTVPRRNKIAMSSKPPTRRSRRASNGEPSLPIIPILIGVIVLGFVIGAGLSLAGRHDLTVVALASPSAAASQTFAPVTPAPSERPTLEPTAAPVRGTDEPISSASAAPLAPVVVATQRPAARRATPHAVTARATSAPSAVAVAAVTAQAVPATAVATETPPAPAVKSNPNAASNASGESNASGSSAVQADSAFAKLSGRRRSPVSRSGQTWRSGWRIRCTGLGAGGQGRDAYRRQGVVDSKTRVGRIDAHSAANDNALVSVQLQTPSGPYFGHIYGAQNRNGRGGDRGTFNS